MKNEQIIHEKVINTLLKDKYLVCEQLGVGVSSRVYKAIKRQSNKQVAIKVIPKSYLNTDKKLLQLVKTQIYILKNCNNQNVVKCYDVFQSSLSIFLVMEYCNGNDMENYIMNKKFLSQDNAIWYLKQILNGFKGLHQIGAMHRDFKLANLLLSDRVCKIADLGFAKQMKQQDLTDTILGTQVTMAPQVLQRKPYGINADIWSLGVVFYQMLTGKYPYLGSTTSDLLKNIKNKNNNFENLRISGMAKNFIQGCLTIDPSARITWVQIYNHPLLNKTSIQLIYGISKTCQIFYQNQNFYRRSSLDIREESLVILRSSARKQIIIQQIQARSQEKQQCLAFVRNSVQIVEYSKILRKNGINYGTYINQLIHPMKFISLQLTKSIPNINHYVPLYLIYKKCFNQIRQFLYVVKKRIDIFKIQMSQDNLWKQFIKCSIYTDLTNIVKSAYDRAEKIYEKIQYIVKRMYKAINIQDQTATQIQKQLNLKMKSLSNFQLDPRIGKQICQRGVDRKQFNSLLKQYSNRYAVQLVGYMNSNLGQKQNYDLVDLIQGLLYYIDRHEKINFNPQKPERFDWNRSLPVVYPAAKKNLTIKMNKLINPQSFKNSLNHSP